MEVVFLVVDYLKRIRPSVITKDLRIDLGSIADDLHVLAVERDIPILTAMQLNRSAIAELDAADSFDKKMQAFGRIGASNVGESIDIPQNVDLTFTMVRTIDTKTNELTGDVESIDKYLSFRIVAARYNTGDIDSFVHRFKEDNDMCLDEDADAQISRSIINKNVLLKDRVASNGIKTRGARHVE